MMLICDKCNIEKPHTEFYRDKRRLDNYRNGYYNSCKSCHTKRSKELRKVKKEAYNKKQREYLQNIINYALDIYNFKCQNCGCDDIRVLQWHHSNGREHNKNDDMKKIVRKIKKAGKKLPQYKLLCANCHILYDLNDKTNKRGKRLIACKEV